MLLPDEEWRDVFEGTYQVSNNGRFRRAVPGRRTWPGRMIQPIKMKIGYLEVRPVIDGKNRPYYLHRIVARAFIGPCQVGFEINHIDGNKANAAASNLEYVSHARNAEHARQLELLPTGESHPNAKLRAADVREIRRRHSCGARNCDLAAEYGVSRTTITQIHQRKRWATV